MAGDPGLAEELGTRWEGPEQPYLWTSVLNLFWRHKKIGHQEEHILSLESKCQSQSLLPSPKERGQKLAAWLVGKGVLAPSSHQLCPRRAPPVRQVEIEKRGQLGFWPFLSPQLPL